MFSSVLSAGSKDRRTFNVAFARNEFAMVSARLLSNYKGAPISPYGYLPPPPYIQSTHLLQHLHRQLRRDRPARDELVKGVRQCHAEAGRVPFELQVCAIRVRGTTYEEPR